MALTIEFWKDQAGGGMRVLFDNVTYSMEDFLRLPEASFVLKKMYDKILTDFPFEATDNEAETVGKFIHAHFSIPDRTFDVVILGDAKNPAVIFNLEQ